MLARCLERVTETAIFLLAIFGAFLAGITLMFYYVLIVVLLVIVGIGWGIGAVMLRLNARTKRFIEHPAVQVVAIMLVIWAIIQIILWQTGLL